MKKYVFGALLLTFLLTSLVSASDEKFPRYIQKGDTGSDVLLLQKVLNSDPDTIVTTTGNGSPGNETDFYGELTKQAVIKLQKKHNLGTKYGFFTIYSGALDEKTRAFLNGLEDTLAKDPCERTLDISDSNSILEFHQKSAQIAESLKPENLIKLGKDSGATSTNQWNALNEMYRLSSAGSSSAPYIRKVEISSKNDSSFLPFASSMMFKNGDKMKITGCNFSTSTPNTVNMTFGKEKATSTDDGTVITLDLKSPIQQLFNKEANGLDSDERDSTASKMPNIPTFITVQNERGISNPYQIFMVVQ